MNERDFANKVEWEGGILGALDYGLRSNDLDVNGPLKQAWERLEDAYRIYVQPALHEVEALLEEIDLEGELDD